MNVLRKACWLFGKRLKDSKTLLEALSAAGYSYPASLDRLTTSVEE